MQRMFHLAQYIAPAIGLVGIAMFAIGFKWEPANWTLAWQGVPLVVLGLIFRPRPGHPMAALLGMHRSQAAAAMATAEPEDTLEAAEAKAFLAEVIKQNVAVLAHEPGDLPHHAQPAKLVPRRPGETGRGRSWIGGAPMLPEGMAWPKTDGAPMLFLAQIALDELPDGIWGGPGPREGWLAFFIPSEGSIREDTRVLHVTGPVSERAWPEVPNEFYFGYHSDEARDALAAAGHPKRPHPPRFPVAVRRHEGPVECNRPDVPGERLRDAIQRDYDPRSPAFRPFDRSTARTLLLGLHHGQRKGLKATEEWLKSAERRLNEAENEETRAAQEKRVLHLRKERDARLTAIASLERLEAALAADPDAPFGPSDADVLLAELGRIEVGVDAADEEDDGAATRRSVLDDGFSERAGSVAFEILVQDGMRIDPDRVPHAVRARYEALWRYDQAREYAVMGGAVHKGFPYSRAEDPAFLLELPSSALIGWMFGDVSRLGIFIAPEDLAAGRWEKVWGDILN